MRPETGGYRPQLDGLRALCVTAVVADHVPGMPAWVEGNFGVDVFFALSGWLITTLLLTPDPTDGRASLRAFYVRRLFRIAPLYGLTILAYAAMAWTLRAAGDPQPWREYLAALPYLASFNYEYRPDAAGMIFGHAWTLGVEEKFYLLWPALLALVPGRTRWALAAAGVVATGLVLLSPDPQWALRGYAGIGAGVALALAARREAVALFLGRRAVAAVAAAAMACLYIASLAAPHDWGWNIAMAGAGAILSGALWLEPASRVARALAVAPLAWVGRLSYGVYLIHVLVLIAVLEGLTRAGVGLAPGLVFALGLTGAILTAWALHRTVERPMIALGRRLARGMGRSTALASAAPVPTSIP